MSRYSYYTAQILDLYTETIANVGQRLYGTEAAAFAVIGPGWDGTLPQGIKAVIRSDTVFANVLLRNLVDGPQDVATVNTLQKQFRIRTLSQFTGTNAVQAPTLEPIVAESPPDRLALLDRTLKMNPVRAGEESLMGIFAIVGIGPAKSVQRLNPNAAVLDRAYADSMVAIQAAGLKAGRLVNGWRLMIDGMGTYGFDYLQRAAVWAGGPLANVPEESFYPTAVTDADGQPLDGHTAYEIRFPVGELPPANAFWSLTMYRMDDGNLVANSINRYSIGNRTAGLNFGADGSLTVYIQPKPPATPSQRANWLPSPEGAFYMVLRIYGPKPEALSGIWKPPVIIRQ